MKQNTPNPTVDIIIPTYNNPAQLTQCLNSMLRTFSFWPFRVIIVNNGNPGIELVLETEFPEGVIEIVECGENLGWTGGLIEGMKRSQSEFVMFANDDIFIPMSSLIWLRSMVRLLRLHPRLAAVGPSTNCAMGLQNIWAPTCRTIYTPFLIGFCVIYRRKMLDEVGGIDPNMRNLDDIDLSIRLRDKGYNLLVDNDIFIYHHGFQTGVRVYGDHTKPGGWNSREMIEASTHQLIEKHGFMKWWRTMIKADEDEIKPYTGPNEERVAVMSYINGCDPSKILEVGCGPTKTVEGSIGLDINEKGKENPHLRGACVADIIHDLDDLPLPIEDGVYNTVIGRHILEHCIDPIAVMRDLYRIIEPGGMAIISVPDERLGDTIMMNPEHIHAFTPESIKNIGEAAGFKYLDHKQGYNGISFTICLEKLEK